MKKMRQLACSVALVGLLGSAPALAALSAADKTFATEAAHGGLAEVQLGQLAEEKATSPQVKEFAQRMVKDHTEANQELMQVSRSENLELPTQLDAQHKSEMDRLRALSGNAFDTAYMQHMVQDHRKTVADFQKQAQSGTDPGLKSFAQNYLPILQQHLQLSERSAAAFGTVRAQSVATTDKDSNAAVQSRGGNDTDVPAKGANSFTEGQAQSRIADRGYSNVDDLKKDDDGVWRGNAQHNGQSVQVWLDYKGNVGEAR
jgi:putative membrane protein